MPSGPIDRRSFITVAGAAAAGFALTSLCDRAPASAATAFSYPGVTGSVPALAGPASAAWDPQAVLQAVVDMRFGMFNHFNLGTFSDEEWASPNQSPTVFAPRAVDTDQWADAAAAAGMTYGILTTKHHDGFALWPTAYGKQNVSYSGYQQDVVAQYVRSFRSRGLKVGLYFSIWDRTSPVQAFGGYHVSDQTQGVDAPKIEYVLGQLTELLTNYGEIEILMTDGYGWQMGQQQVPYQQVRDLVKRLQPKCVMIDLGGMRVPWLGDAIFFEEPLGISSPPGNTYAGVQGQTISNGWFWHPSTPTESLMSKNDIVSHLHDLENKWTSFILNCPPNRDGRLDDNVVARLVEVGAAWSTPTSRAPLPAQTLRVEHPITPVAAYASAFRDGEGPYLAIDGRSDINLETCWSTWPGTAALALPQSLTIDLGGVYEGVTTLGYLPKQWRRNNTTDGDITSWEVATSQDGRQFATVAQGTWAPDQTLKVAKWPAVTAGFVRLTAKSGTGGYSNVNGVAVGGRAAKPVRLSSAVATDRLYKVVNRHSGKVLAVAGGDTAEGASVVQADDTGAQSQQWTLAARDNGYLALIVKNSGKLLAIGGRSRTAGSTASVGTDARVLEQNWAVTPIADGQCIVTNRFSALALAVTSGSDDAGAGAEQQVYTGAPHQQWTLVDITPAPASTATVTLTSADAPSSDGWYANDVLVTMSAPAGAVAQYRLDGGTWKTYSRTFTVTTNADHVVSHRLVRDGIVVGGSQATTAVRIDKAVPTAVPVVSPSNAVGTPRNPVTVSLQAGDALSGLDRVEYQINQSAWTPIDIGETLTLSSIGTFLVSYRSFDKAGNVSRTGSRTVRIGANTTTAIRASAGSVSPGGFITFVIAGFARADTVTVRAGDAVLTTVVTDATGAGRVTVRFPPGVPMGATTMTASGSTGEPVATTRVTVT